MTRVVLLGDSDQLSLGLFADVPWEGHSPRALTSARKALYLRPEPQGHEVFVDPEQYDLWPSECPHRESAPRKYLGAPLLIPFSRRLEDG